MQQTQICLAYEHVDVALSLVRARRPAATETAVDRAIDDQVGQNRVLQTRATDGPRSAWKRKRLWRADCSDAPSSITRAATTTAASASARATEDRSIVRIPLY